jgi:thiol-disulfide isomerase/thioredoxin
MKPSNYFPLAIFAIFAAIPILIAIFAQTDKGPLLGGWMEQFNVIEAPGPVPDVAFEDGAGRKITLGDFAGRVVLVNFWATWCAPCVREMPSLDRLQARLGGKDFTVVAVDEDRDGKEVGKPFMAKLGLAHLDFYLDHRMALSRALGVRGLPTSFLIDRESRVVGRHDGFAEWDTPEVEALIRYYAGEIDTKTGANPPSR